MMRVVIGIVLASMLLIVNCKAKQGKKSLVVEVQSHNQAMKSANPITDLEQTIRQGMKDPFTDPRFVMNRINSEFFGNGLKNNMDAGTPMVENSLHDRELMAFTNLGLNAPQSMMNSPSGSITQHAIKENSVPMGLREGQKRFPNMKKLLNLLGSKKQLSSAKISAVHSPMNINRMALEPKIATDLNVAHLNAESIKPSAVNSGSSPVSSTETSTPVDASFSSQSVPSTVESSSSSSNIGDRLSAMLAQKGTGSSDIMPANPGLISGKEMEDNYSSIQAFLEADSSLRQKKVLDPVTNPLEDLMHKKHHVPKAKSLKKVVRSR